MKINGRNLKIFSASTANFSGEPGEILRSEDELIIAAGKEAVALVLQLAAQLAKIVDATIKGNGEAKLRINHRLLRSLVQVKNVEAAMAERDLVLQKQSAGIGPARRERPAHGGDRCGAGLSTIKSNFAADPAHIEMVYLAKILCAKFCCYNSGQATTQVQQLLPT